MAQYNLMISGFVQSSTYSGTGNTTLTITQLNSLYDNDLDNSIISLNITDTLFLDIDLFNRVRISNIHLFIDVAGDRDLALTKVDFYYKNNIEDVYTLCNKAQDIDKFYVTDLPELFSPRFIRIVISDLSCSLFELKILSSDVEVSFGPEGSLNTTTVTNGLSGYDSVEIFNNSEVGTPPVDAYIIVDYTQDSDYYIKLSSSSDGEYLSLSDGGLLDNGSFANKYKWKHGYLEDTYVRNESVILDPRFPDITVGSYTTPIISLGDPLMSSFLFTDKTVISGTSITQSSNLDKDSVLIRSSNTPPIAFKKFFIVEARSNTDIFIYEGDLTTGGSVSKKIFTFAYPANTFNVMFYKDKSQFYISTNRDIRIYNYSIAEDGFVASTSDSINNDFSNTFGIDGAGYVWAYSMTGGFKLRILYSNLSVNTVLIDGGTLPFLFALSPGLKTNTCWYTNSSVKKVYHIDTTGSAIFSKSLTNPTYICSLYDGGCWVVDAGTAEIIRYSYGGTEQKRIKYSSEYSIISISYNIDVAPTTTYHERFWVVTSIGTIIQYDFNGNAISYTTIPSATNVNAFVGGCLVFCSSAKKIYQLDSIGAIVRIWDLFALGNLGTKPNIAVIEYEDYINLPESASLLPFSDDPVWGYDHANGWKEIIDNGYMLPFAKYHQLKYKLDGQAINVPIVNPGFEDDLVGWTAAYGFVVYTLDAYTGTKSAGNVTAYNSSTAYQVIDLNSIIDISTIDNSFLLSCGVWGKNITTNLAVNGYFQIKLYDYDNNYIYNSTYASNIGTKNYWHRLFTVINLFSGVRYVELTLVVVRVDNASYYIFDDVDVQIIRTPSIDRINIPKPTKLQDIHPQTYKNLYIKTDFPVGAQYGNYESRLKCWWGNEEI